MPRRKVERGTCIRPKCAAARVPSVVNDSICEECMIAELTRAISGAAPPISNIPHSMFPEEVASRMDDTESGMLALISEHYLRENKWQAEKAKQAIYRAIEELRAKPKKELISQFKEIQRMKMRRGELTIKKSKSDLDGILGDKNYHNILITVLLLLNITGYGETDAAVEPEPEPHIESNLSILSAEIMKPQDFNELCKNLHLLCGEMHKRGELCDTMEHAFLNFGKPASEGRVNLLEILKQATSKSEESSIMGFRPLIHEYDQRCTEGKTRISPLKVKKKRKKRKLSRNKIRPNKKHQKREKRKTKNQQK